MKTSTLDRLTDPNLQIVLCYSPAGLGHLRVMDALHHGLPDSVRPVVMGSQDESIRRIHRLTSTRPVPRAIFEWLQMGPLSSAANRLLRNSVRRNPRPAYDEIVRILAERREPAKEILAACTHFGLGHQLAELKQKVQRERGVRLIVAVVVTDDSFQQIWFVDGADLLVAPSQLIQRKYAAYGARLGESLRIEVASYPVYPGLGKPLDEARLRAKSSQLDAAAVEPIHVSVPISGAAVGTGYASQLTGLLRQKSERFTFHIVAQEAPFTQTFIDQVRGRPGIDLRLGKQDFEAIDAYNKLLTNEVISMELTKPSEQSFKCLIPAQSCGGVILLLTPPVGKQEFENIDFMERHSLIPSAETNLQIWRLAEEGRTDAAVMDSLLAECGAWRGVRVPGDPEAATKIIWWMLTSGLLSRMLAGTLDRKIIDEGSRVLGPNGVSEFWDLAATL